MSEPLAKLSRGSLALKRLRHSLAYMAKLAQPLKGQGTASPIW